MLALVVAILAVTGLLWMNRDFIDYALTGLSWSKADGVIINTKTTDKPSVQFSTADVGIRIFKEDYNLLCGTRHSICFDRNFAPGEVVPVVYDPNSSTRAFIHDWALTANVISVFIEAGIWFFLVVLLIFPGIVSKSSRMSIQVGGNPEPGQSRSTDL